jgi:nucleotide-binding universal stress UspA family protein
MYQKILIVLEGQGTDETVLAHARALAAQMGAQVTLLRVIAVADGGGGGLGKQFQLEIGSNGWRRRNEAEGYLSKWEGQLRQKGLLVETALVIGTRSEGDEIVTYAAENGQDLIVMASDPRPWYRRLLRSAQDDDVLHRATVPTLFVNDGSREPPTKRTVPEGHPLMAVLGSADL